MGRATTSPVESAAPATTSPEVVLLVDLARDGDQAAFADLYDLYVRQVYGYIRRRVGSTSEAEDLTGDVFLRAWRRFDRFEWKGVDLGAWFMTIARNRVNDHFKSSPFRLERSTDTLADRAEATPDDPERVAMGRDMARTLGRALEALKDPHREVIELRFIHDLSVTETAAVLGRTIGATKALQYRALRALADEVRGQPGFDAILASGFVGLISLLGVLG